jgi:hypothetical protein
MLAWKGKTDGKGNRDEGNRGMLERGKGGVGVVGGLGGMEGRVEGDRYRGAAEQGGELSHARRLRSAS